MCTTIVVSFHGRANQGIATAVGVLSKAAVSSQFCVQSMFFGSQERTGRVWGLVKMDKNPIQSKQKEMHDFTLLFDAEAWKEAVNFAKDSSFVIFNTTQKVNTGPLRKRRIKSFSLDASGIGILTINRPTPAMAMLGALAKNFGKISMKAIKSSAEYLHKENLAAVEEGYKTVKMVK